MDKNTQRVFAIGLILFGGLMILSNFMDISFGKVTWALIIIFAGVILITRPDIFHSEGVLYKMISDFSLDESWTVKDYTLRAFISDIDLDLEFAEFPEGETNFNISCFVGDITITKPDDVGLKIRTSSFLTDSKVRGSKGEIFFSGLDYQSEGYEEALKKMDVQLNGFVIEVDA